MIDKNVDDVDIFSHWWKTHHGCWVKLVAFQPNKEEKPYLLGDGYYSTGHVDRDWWVSREWFSSHKHAVIPFGDN